MRITEIYQSYKIPPMLQEHHLRVAAVAKLIASNLATPIDIENIVQACLVHDMGNIIKFDLTLFPENYEKEGLAYWQDVKAEFIRKYGNDEHQAAFTIAKEIGVNQRVYEILQAIGFPNAEVVRDGSDMAKKICIYSDQRVAPHGVLSLIQRTEEGRERFRRNKLELAISQEKSGIFEKMSAAIQEIEQQIFAECAIEPEDVNDQTIHSLMEEVSLVEF